MTHFPPKGKEGQCPSLPPALVSCFQRVALSLVREPCFPYQPTIHNACGAVDLVLSVIRDDPREHFLSICLDARHKVQAVHVVAVGAVDSCPVRPRDVFMPAVHLGSSAIIIAHNHPSGDPSPSSADRSLTERMRLAGDLLGIEVLDHLVIGHTAFFSFSDEQTQPVSADFSRLPPNGVTR